MRNLTAPALMLLAATPSRAHETGHAHAHSSDTILFGALALIAAAICGWLVARATRGPK